MSDRSIPGRKRIVRARRRNDRLTHGGLASEKQNRNVVDSSEGAADCVDGQSMPVLAALDSIETVQVVQHAIETVISDNKDRQLLNRCVLGTESYADVAPGLELTELAARCRVCRAKAKLRGYLAAWYRENHT